ncbi:hypothetical protein X975_00420, partial [Stegodyphus mimosarum]
MIHTSFRWIRHSWRISIHQGRHHHRRHNNNIIPRDKYSSLYWMEWVSLELKSYCATSIY